MTPDLKEYLNEVSEREKSAHSRQDIPTLLKIVEVQAEAIDLLKEKMPRCECIDGHRFASEAQQAVSDILKAFGVVE